MHASAGRLYTACSACIGASSWEQGQEILPSGLHTLVTCRAPVRAGWSPSAASVAARTPFIQPQGFIFLSVVCAHQFHRVLYTANNVVAIVESQNASRPAQSTLYPAPSQPPALTNTWLRKIWGEKEEPRPRAIAPWALALSRTAALARCPASPCTLPLRRLFGCGALRSSSASSLCGSETRAGAKRGGQDRG